MQRAADLKLQKEAAELDTANIICTEGMIQYGASF